MRILIRFIKNNGVSKDTVAFPNVSGWPTSLNEIAKLTESIANSISDLKNTFTCHS